MTLRHLKIFVTVCQYNSITRASEKLYMSQPSISLAIKEMEERYGEKLFERYSRKLRITPFGEELYRYALRIVSLFDEMDENALSHKRGELIRVGTGTTVGQNVIPSIINQFRQDYPNSDVSVMVDHVKYLRDAIIDNRIDFAIAESVLGDPIIRTLCLKEDSLEVICHKDNPLAQKKIVTAKDLAKENILARHDTSYIRKAMDTYFAVHDLAVTPKWVSSDGLALLYAVRANLGITILPKNHIRIFNEPDVVILNVPDFKTAYHLNLYVHRDKILTPLMLEFISRFSDNKITMDMITENEIT